MGKPGRSRSLWGICTNEAREGFWRCDECFHLLATSPDPEVRLALAREEALPDEIVQVLATDPNIEVVRAITGQGLAAIINIDRFTKDDHER